jgi:hypothetical protein
MTPRLRRLILQNLLEIRGAFPGKGADLVGYSDEKLLQLVLIIERAFDRMQTTDPAPPIDDVGELGEFKPPRR